MIAKARDVAIIGLAIWVAVYLLDEAASTRRYRAHISGPTT